MRYTQHYSKLKTSQAKPLAGRAMVANDAGGYVFAVSDWTRLRRFLILGSEGGTYYAGERVVTIDNAKAVERCLAADGPRVVREVLAVSEGGCAPRNDPALFVLALCTTGDEATRREAFAVLPRVARTGTHLFTFVTYMKDLRGWGKLAHRGLARWYVERDLHDLELQLAKYQGRSQAGERWTHRDVLRKARPKVEAGPRNAALAWAVGHEADLDGLPLLAAVEAVRHAERVDDVVRLIETAHLPRECVPTQWLTEPAVWLALLPQMPPMALLRNLAKLAGLGLLAGRSEACEWVAKRFARESLLRARLHPLAILLGLRQFAQGRGDKGRLTWPVAPQVVDVLGQAFHDAFAVVEPTGRRLLLAVDCSGSMDGTYIAGTSLSAREAAGALAMVTAAVEPSCQVVGFTAGPHRDRYGFGSGLTALDISARRRLDDVLRVMRGVPFGGTDCALPMLWATEQRLAVDAFVVITDNETWAGSIHPTQALAEYRQKTGLPAKLAVMALTSTGYSIADPDDAGQMDMVGFDTATPTVLADFLRG
ncbi:MAG: TROVE domain-containing protein [Armatimonadetes bacterium]|nr:TROVE domain-containing protein [Armatimonadota bacterium]